MKYRLSITMDKETIEGIREKLRESCFRNKSHLVEFAVKKLLDEKSAGLK